MAHVFHEGELAVQAKVVQASELDAMRNFHARVIRKAMPDQHRLFYTEVPFMIAASPDKNGRVWTTILSGKRGFIKSPTDTQLIFDTSVNKGDALDGQLDNETPVGMLGIMLKNRRRNRVNGVFVGDTSDSLSVRVTQAYGNCPQYISTRVYERIKRKQPSVSETRQFIDESMKDWIQNADTFFVGSGHPKQGFDASHRGGPRGFVSVLNPNMLSWPDYSGNRMFNTLGNLLLDPRAGLLFIDFETGSTLQLTGTVELQFGENRRCIFTVERVVRVQNAINLRWKRNQQQLVVVKKVQETAAVMSVYLAGTSPNATLAPFSAGQHLPLNNLNTRGVLGKSYSLSGPAVGTNFYRISVKKIGRVSSMVHSLPLGDVITADPPAGDFVYHTSKRPAVLLSAGIGITPLLSMLYSIRGTQLTLIHSEKTLEDVPMVREISDLVRQHNNITVKYILSSTMGRIDSEKLRGYNNRFDYYICGPRTYMGVVKGLLEANGVPEAQIYAEEF